VKLHRAVFFLTFVIACSIGGQKQKMDNSIMKEGYAESDNVKLHYMQWGSTGPILVLICGLGDTPYIFRELADGLSTDFRIIGYSRREHGKSASKIPGYTNETLVADLKLLLDHLGIDKASLLGWSLGGNEITGFAVQYPQRVDKLVYFESGYDLSDKEFKALMKSLPSFILPGEEEMKSLDAYKNWYHRFWFGDIPWNETLENNFMASLQVNPDRSVVTLPNDSVSKAILTEAMKYRREYDKVQAPALVIYAEPFFYPPQQSEDVVKLYDDIERKIVVPWRQESKRRMRDELRNVVIVNMPHGTHTSFLFLNRDTLLQTIKDFLN
jgi:pimeloyl-ACP methyl ester carboxylesterase